METDFPFVQISEELLPLIGERQTDTRIYRQEGGRRQLIRWFDALDKHIGTCVSPGGVAMYAGATRAGVYKRMNNGLLTAFCFHMVEHTKPIFGRALRIKDHPYIYIPISECRAWQEELEERFERLNDDRAPVQERRKAERAIRDAIVPHDRAAEIEEDTIRNDPKDKGRRIRIVKVSKPKKKKG